jgi:hypothetical protein
MKRTPLRLQPAPNGGWLVYDASRPSHQGWEPDLRAAFSCAEDMLAYVSAMVLNEMPVVDEMPDVTPVSLKMAVA